MSVFVHIKTIRNILKMLTGCYLWATRLYILLVFLLFSLPYFLCAFLKIIKHYFKKGRKEVVFINGCFHTGNAGLRLGCMYVAGQGSMARQQPGIFKELLATDSFLQPQHGIGGG